MKQKYVYSYNGVANWLKGLLPLERNSKSVSTYHGSANQPFVWRNSITDGYKISESYQDSPMDLSNYLLIRMRERLLLESKIGSPSVVMKSGKYNYFT